jgi:uncharacterized protein YqhQ
MDPENQQAGAGGEGPLALTERRLQPGQVIRGSALPNGVVIATARFTATATREPDGSIAATVEHTAPTGTVGTPITGWPLLRGVVDLAPGRNDPIMQLLIFAMVATCPPMFAVAESIPRQPVGWLVAAGALAYPFWAVITATRMVPKFGDWYHYHAAEHQTIFCLNKAQPLTVENAAQVPPIDPRCGSGDTAWWILGMWLTLPLVDLLWPQGWVAALVESIPVILLGVAIGGEINTVVRNHHAARWAAPLTWPAWWLQRTSTMGRAGPEHLEVAIAAAELLAAASTAPDDLAEGDQEWSG